MSGAGFVNAHTHVYSGLAPLGMPLPRHEPSNFLEMLERVWWRLDRALDARSLRAAARLYVAEALRHGTTVLVDHHESPSFIEGSLDVIADACEELGIRAVLCYGATERNGGRDEATRGLAECRRFIRSNHRPLVRGVVGLHASFTLSDDTIREAGDMCRELDAVVHVHVAEDRADVDDALRRGYLGPVERLHALGGLPAGSILAHGVHLNAAQVRKADTLGCWIVQNPRSNRHNKVGYPRALAESARVALGTDGFVSDMREEMAVLLEEALAHGEDAVVVECRAAGGQALVAELCGFAADRPAAPEISDEMVHEIRAEAREAAAILWKRMAEL
jgi:cytosine/adenosine deaminase-related metal-dependent hydrolase